MAMPLQWIKRLTTAKESLSEGDIEKGIRAVTWDGICSMSMGALQGGAFLTAFALAVGANNFDIGLIAAIGMGSQLMQIPGLYLADRLPYRRGLTIAFAGASRLLWVFILLTPLLFLNRGITIVVFILFLVYLLANVPSPAWNSVLRDIIPEKRLGSVFGRRMMLGSIAAMSLTLLGGYFIDFWKASYPGQATYGYSILFTLGLIFGLLSLFFVYRVPEPVMEGRQPVSLTELLSVPFKDPNFRGLIIFMGIWNLAINLVSPFFTIYMLERLELPLFTITILFTVSQLAVIIFLPIWGKISDRFNNKSVLRVCAPLFLFVTIAWCFTTLPDKYFLTVPLLYLIQVFGGIAFAGLALAGGNISLKLAPQGQAMSYLTAISLVAAVAGVIGPLLGGILGHFLDTRELSLWFQFTQPGADIIVHAVHFRGLDFLFIITFFIGLFALGRLAYVKEEGEVTEKVVLQEVLNEVLSPMRSVASIGGLTRMTALPLEIAARSFTRVRSQRGSKGNSQP